MNSSVTATETTTMRAIAQHAYGSAEVLESAVLPIPEIADDEVLVRVHAAGVDRGTVHLMTGTPYLMRVIGFGFRRPKNVVPGLAVAGTVASVGSAVTRFAVGDEVYGIGKGAFAEFSAAKEKKLALKPAGLTFEQAAAVPVSASTAYQALHTAGRLEVGQKVLVLGASGGVGTFAIQLSKAHGAEVTGVSSAAKVDLVRSLGADHVIDHTAEDFAERPECYDLILDIGGNASRRRLGRALTPTGTVVFIGGENGDNFSGSMGRPMRAGIRSLLGRQRFVMLASKEHAVDLELMAPLFDSGQVVPSVERTYDLDEVHEAVSHVAAGRARGKVVISVVAR